VYISPIKRRDKNAVRDAKKGRGGHPSDEIKKKDSTDKTGR